MPDKKLDLLQLAIAEVTQLGTIGAQIVRSEVIELKAAGTVPNGIPDDTLGDPVHAPDSSRKLRTQQAGICDESLL